jgi:putative hemolysin
VNEIQLVIGGILLLLILDLGTIMARASFQQTSYARVLSLRENMETQVNSTLVLLHEMPRTKASLNLFLVLLRFALAGLLFYLVSQWQIFEPLLLRIAALLISALVLFGLEWVVEKYAIHNAENLSVRLTPFVRVLIGLMAFFLWIMRGFSRGTQEPTDSAISVTEDELKTLVDAGQEEGIFEKGERRMIYSIFQLGETLAREIMVPRIDMLALDVSTPLFEAVDAFLRSGHSRVPVFEESVDNTLGLLYAKDLLRVWREGNQLESLRELLRPAYFVPEAKKVDELLTEMQSQRVHMAIVVDEYGGVAGLVTLEDIVEEILGEIRDEYDQAEESPYQILGDGEYLFQGRVDLDDFNEIMGSDLPKDEADTIGGLIYSQMGRVPDAGDSVRQDNMLLTVEQVSGRRIRKVRARWLPSEPQENEEKNADKR